MEKMDSEKVCAHEKVFRAVTEGSEVPWICRLCGAEGSAPLKFDVGPNEYMALKFKKTSGGFTHGR